MIAHEPGRRRNGSHAPPPLRFPPSVAAHPLNTTHATGLTADHRGWHFRLSPARRSRQGHSGRAEPDKAPPCMRWRGLARPHRTGWSVAWPCRRRAPHAGARHPYEAPVSRLLPRSRGRPQVVPVSSGGIFLLDTRAPRKSLRPAISGFLRYPRRNPQKAGSYPPLTAVIHRFIHSISSARDVSRGTPGLLSPDVTADCSSAEE